MHGDMHADISGSCLQMVHGLGCYFFFLTRASCGGVSWHIFLHVL